MTPAQTKYRIFISYMHKDIEKADYLFHVLSTSLWWKYVFLDQRCIRPGDPIGEIIQPETYDNLVVLHTEWTQSSWWVGFECGRAWTNKQQITIVSGDDTPTDKFTGSLGASQQRRINLEDKDDLAALCEAISMRSHEKVIGYFQRLKKGDNVSIVEDADSIRDVGYGREFTWISDFRRHVGRTHRVVKKFPLEMACQLDIKGCEFHWPMEWLNVIPIDKRSTKIA